MLFKVFLLLVILLKLWLFDALAMQAVGAASHDDYLYLKLANSILTGEWLGTYDNLTLAKPFFYSIWIAINFLIGLPLLLSQQLVYLIAGVILAFALKKHINQYLLLGLFILYAFNPEHISRVVREGIYPALTILTLALFFAIYSNRIHFKQHITYAVLAGIALTMFWLTREEGVWLIPSILILFSYTAYSIFTERKVLTFYKIRLLILVVPFLIFYALTNLISYINYKNYGVYQVYEMQSKPFVPAYAALTRIKHEHWNPYLPVPKAVREQLYIVSPTFSELKPYFEGKSGHQWGTNNCGFYPDTCGDIARGWFHWAFRAAVASQGYYTSAIKAQAFYQKIADEVNHACEQQKLNCFNKKDSLFPIFQDNTYFVVWGKSFFSSLSYVFNLIGFNELPRTEPSSGNIQTLNFFEDITREKHSILINQNAVSHILSISGWAFNADPNTDGKVMLALQAEPAHKGNIDYELKIIKSNDVSSHFKNDNAIDARFHLTSSCFKDCSILFYDSSNTILAKLMLADRSVQIFNPQFQYHFDAFTALPNNHDESLLQTELDKIKINILHKIAKLYQLIWTPILWTSLVLFFIIAVIELYYRKLSILLISATCLLTAIAARLAIVSLINVTSFPAINPFYLAPIYPLIFVFSCIIIIYCITYFKCLLGFIQKKYSVVLSK